ncbi:Hint domain-containing protein [Pseudooceanicola sp. 200-1SW]|uniref:Hint domain-containing protein n=1 Tax=Pseudooceanicola sp. 200-1SW TaxID=3425949 RepID=UPI003D7F19C3
MATVSFTLRGDQIATYSSYSGNGNNSGRVVTVEGVSPIGDASDSYTVLVEQVNEGTTQFQNGQFVTILDADGNIVMPRTGVNPDAEQGLAAGDEHILFIQSNFLIDYAGFEAGSSTFKIQHSDEKADPGIGDNDGQFDWTDQAAFVCIASGSLIDMVHGGPRPVEELLPGDLVPTVSGRMRRVLWVGQGHMSFDPDGHKQKPILFKAGVLGNGLPRRDLMLSPQHRVLLGGPDVAALTGEARVLAPACGLVPLPGVRVMRGRRDAVYVSVLLDRHDVIRAEGAPVESFWPGPEGLKRLDPMLRAAVHAEIPGLLSEGVAAYGPPAARLMRVQETLRLARALRTGMAEARAEGRAPRPLIPALAPPEAARARRTRSGRTLRFEGLLDTGYEGLRIRA